MNATMTRRKRIVNATATQIKPTPFDEIDFDLFLEVAYILKRPKLKKTYELCNGERSVTEIRYMIDKEFDCDLAQCNFSKWYIAPLRKLGLINYQRQGKKFVYYQVPHKVDVLIDANKFLEKYLR